MRKNAACSRSILIYTRSASASSHFMNTASTPAPPVRPPAPLSGAESLKSIAPQSPTQLAWRRLRRSTNGMVGLVIVLFITLIAFITPIVDPYDPSIDSNMSLSRKPPSLDHPFGNDFIGRDIFRRVMHGARYSLIVAMMSILIGTTLSTTIGMIAGYFGGKVDMIVQRFTEILLAFPAIPLAIAVVAVLGPSLLNTVLAITIVGIPGGLRVTRAMALSLKTREYVDAARSQGATNTHVITRHILPNLISVVIVGATLGVGGVILQAAALGFLGLGAQPPTPEWGVMVSDAIKYYRQAPHMALFPGLAIMITVLGFNLLGDGIRDALDPTLSGGK
jgi:peptide/nickel transport system permease protein